LGAETDESKNKKQKAKGIWQAEVARNSERATKPNRTDPRRLWVDGFRGKTMKKTDRQNTHSSTMEWTCEQSQNRHGLTLSDQ